MDSNLPKLKTKASEFSLHIQSRYALLEDQDLNIDQIDNHFNERTNEAALEVGGKNEKRRSNKLSVETKKLFFSNVRQA